MKLRKFAILGLIATLSVITAVVGIAPGFELGMVIL